MLLFRYSWQIRAASFLRWASLLLQSTAVRGRVSLILLSQQSPLSKLLLPLSALWGGNFRKAKGRAGKCEAVTASGFTGTVCQFYLLCKVHSHLVAVRTTWLWQS